MFWFLFLWCPIHIPPFRIWSHFSVQRPISACFPQVLKHCVSPGSHCSCRSRGSKPGHHQTCLFLSLSRNHHHEQRCCCLMCFQPMLLGWTSEWASPLCRGWKQSLCHIVSMWNATYCFSNFKSIQVTTIEDLTVSQSWVPLATSMWNKRSAGVSLAPWSMIRISSKYLPHRRKDDMMAQKEQMVVSDPFMST